MFVAAIGAGALFGAASVVALTILSRLRHLIFDSMTANVNGVAAVIARFPDMEGTAERLKTRLRDRAALLAVSDRRVFGAVHHDRHADRLVGAVAVLARLVGIPDVHKLSSSADTGPLAPCRRGAA